jgi:hypothetical protein
LKRRNERLGKTIIGPFSRHARANVSDMSSKNPAIGLYSMARSSDLTRRTSVAVLLMLVILMMDDSSLAPAMAIARVAYEDGFLLDAILL